MQIKIGMGLEKRQPQTNQKYKPRNKKRREKENEGANRLYLTVLKEVVGMVSKSLRSSAM